MPVSAIINNKPFRFTSKFAKSGKRLLVYLPRKYNAEVKKQFGKSKITVEIWREIPVLEIITNFVGVFSSSSTAKYERWLITIPKANHAMISPKDWKNDVSIRVDKIV